VLLLKKRERKKEQKKFFFGVGPVWSTVRQRSTRNKVNLVLNTLEWWQPRWNFTWKNISIFLQNVSHNRGQRLLQIV
jgi:hypothetical protein